MNMLKIKADKDFSAEDINELQKAFDIIGGKVTLIQNDNCVTVSFKRSKSKDKSVIKPRLISCDYNTSETIVYRPLEEMELCNKKEENLSITVELFEWYTGISDDIIELACEEARKHHLTLKFVDITIVDHSDKSKTIISCMPINELFDLDLDYRTNDNKVFFLSDF